MANLLITGASGGMGQHICCHLMMRHKVMPLSRNPSADTIFAPCDLVTDIPRSNDPVDVDWIIHMATTYRIEDDLVMLDNLLKFADQHNVKNFLYVSSWVVHFPHRLIGASYIKMKRRCEQRLLESKIANPCIVRPSVIIGPGLSWTRVLKKLAPYASLIPPQFSRSFVTIDEVCHCIDKIIEGQTHSNVVTCLGTRRSLAEKARERRTGRVSRPVWSIIGAISLLILVTIVFAPQFRATIIASLGICFVLLLGLRYTLPAILGYLSDYFAGFVERRFEPESEQDLIALCHRDNDNIQVRGYDNAKLYFQSPHSPHHTTVCLRRFNRVLKIDPDQNLVEVQAGAHFGELLPLLESRGLWLDNYPNYHFISVGACIVTAVHGSNLDKPFLADLVESIRFYDRDEDRITEWQRDDAGFSSLIFNRECPPKRIILSAQLRVCPRPYYELTSKRQPLETLSFEDTARFHSETQHYEVRINTPMSRNAVLQSYRQVMVNGNREEKTNGSKWLPIKADAIGRKWNLLQSNILFSTLTSVASRLFINYEWFFSPEEFTRFWQEISNDRSRYRLYKLLVRYNRRQSDLNTPYHGTVSIDVTIFNTRSMLDAAAELFQRYRPLEHLGKYSIERYIHRRDDRQTAH